MPKQKVWIVTGDFDFVPRPGVVMTFKAGQERRGLPRQCVAKGLSLGKLAIKEKQHGKTDHLQGFACCDLP
jgi:hypothetical protein